MGCEGGNWGDGWELGKSQRKIPCYTRDDSLDLKDYIYIKRGLE